MKSKVVSFQDICDRDIAIAKAGTYADGLREGFQLAINKITHQGDCSFIENEGFIVSLIKNELAEWEKNIGSNL